MSTLTVICRIRKIISIYKKYVCNSGKNDFNPLANHIYAKIKIISIIDLNFFEYYSNKIV